MLSIVYFSRSVTFSSKIFYFPQNDRILSLMIVFHPNLDPRFWLNVPVENSRVQLGRTRASDKTKVGSEMSPFKPIVVSLCHFILS